jgi:hypothetical protein
MLRTNLQVQLVPQIITNGIRVIIPGCKHAWHIRVVTGMFIRHESQRL